MKKSTVILLAALAVLALGAIIVGCGSSSDTVFLTIGEPYVQGASDPDPFPGMLQKVAPEDIGGTQSPHFFPGHANMWDLDTDFMIQDGGDDQFDGVLALSVNSVAAPAVFTSFSAQTYADLTFYTPLAGSSDGVVTAGIITDTDLYSGSYDSISLVVNGTYSAALMPVSGARLEQTLNLTSATGSVSLDWTDNVFLSPSLWSLPVSYNVSIINSTTGEVMEEIFAATSDASETARNGDLTAYAGEVVVLRFQSSGSISEWEDVATVIDDVSVQDGVSTEFVTNGDFETGNLTGWSVPEVKMAINVMSAPETLGDVSVTRSFYTTPNKLWGRITDTFTNPDVSDVSITVKYSSNLGSDNYGIIYNTPGTGGKAITEWDGQANDRDFGFVMGAVDRKDMPSDDIMGSGGAGNNDIYHEFDITVPAGESVTLVQFIVMTGVDTGLTASDVTATADKVDAENLRILNSFNSSIELRNGMTQAQIANVLNF